MTPYRSKHHPPTRRRYGPRAPSLQPIRRRGPRAEVLALARARAELRKATECFTDAAAEFRRMRLEVASWIW